MGVVNEVYSFSVVRQNGDGRFLENSDSAQLFLWSSNFNDQNFVRILLARSTFRSLLFKNLNGNSRFCDFLSVLSDHHHQMLIEAVDEAAFIETNKVRIF